MMTHWVHNHLGGTYISNQSQEALEEICPQCGDADQVIVSWQDGEEDTILVPAIVQYVLEDICYLESQQSVLATAFAINDGYDGNTATQEAVTKILKDIQKGTVLQEFSAPIKSKVIAALESYHASHRQWLADCGLEPFNEEKFVQAIHKPQEIITYFGAAFLKHDLSFVVDYFLDKEESRDPINLDHIIFPRPYRSAFVQLLDTHFPGFASAYTAFVAAQENV